MSTTTNLNLDHTVIARWHARLADNPSPRRNHWQTKTLYYEAAAELLSTHPKQPLTWKSIVAARPSGCRSTFYEVAGAHARHRMVGDLIADGSEDSVQIALHYLRQDPVEQLIDETKVWSYWSFRQYLLTKVITPGLPPERAADALTRTLVVWVRRNPALAAALNHCPPACAVEDLTVLHQGRLAAIRAANQLTDVLRHAVPPTGAVQPTGHGG